MALTRVAVADDDVQIRDLLEALLTDEGYAVTSIGPGRDMLAELRAARPGVIILDWRLSGGDGTAFEAVRSDPALRDIPILICTGDLEGMRRHAPLLATQPHVVILDKPFQIDVLSAVLERLAAAAPSPAVGRVRPPTLSPELAGDLGRGGVRAQAAAIARRFRATDGWACSELWLSERGLLRCGASARDRERRGFVENSRSVSLVPGFGLPGRIWVSRRPAWIASIANDRNFPREATAVQYELRSAAGVAVMLGSAVVAAICVYAAEPRPEEAGTLERLDALAAGLGPWADAARGELLRPDPVSAAARQLAGDAARLADVAAVDLSEKHDVHRVAVAHRDPDLAEVAMRLEAFTPAPRGPVARAIETGEVQRLAVSEAALRDWSGSPEHLQLLRALRLNSLVTVPLVDRGDTFGAVTLSSADRAWHASRSATAAIAALASSPACMALARLQRRRRSDARRS